MGWHLAEVEEWLRSREPVERQTVERTLLRRTADRELVSGTRTLAAGGALAEGPEQRGGLGEVGAVELKGEVSPSLRAPGRKARSPGWVTRFD